MSYCSKFKMLYLVEVYIKLLESKIKARKELNDVDNQLS